MRKFRLISTLTGAFIILSTCTPAQEPIEVSSFPILDTQGAQIGTLEITALLTGGVKGQVDIKGLTPGTHAMHFHEFGACEAPDFKSAGGHYNPAAVAHGHHAGDMMNINVAENGIGTFKVINDKVNLKGGTLPAFMDSDGTALIIHAGADDYVSQPSGAAGPRVACAVIPAG